MKIKKLILESVLKDLGVLAGTTALGAGAGYLTGEYGIPDEVVNPENNPLINNDEIRAQMSEVLAKMGGATGAALGTAGLAVKNTYNSVAGAQNSEAAQSAAMLGIPASGLAGAVAGAATGTMIPTVELMTGNDFGIDIDPVTAAEIGGAAGLAAGTGAAITGARKK